MAETIRIGPLVLRFLRDRHETGDSLDLFEMDVPPAARMPEPHYHGDWDETVYGLAGTVTFTVGGKPVEIGPGDTVFIRRGIVHGFENRRDGPATCLVALTPGVLGPGYFREMATLAAGGPPDRARMLDVMRRHGLVPTG